MYNLFFLNTTTNFLDWNVTGVGTKQQNKVQKYLKYNKISNGYLDWHCDSHSDTLSVMY